MGPRPGRAAARLAVAVAVGAAGLPLARVGAGEPAPVAYELSFPEAAQRWMQVEVRFSGLGDSPLDLRMSRSSPGRYALHEFAKNVHAVSASDGAGRPLSVDRPDRHGWTIAGHDGTVVVEYQVYGDRVDGTYLGVDSTHAHVNMPAALVWARGLEERRAEVRIAPPPGSAWKVATQLFPGSDPWTWTAPNLQYLMDSPIEASDHLVATFRLAANADGSGAERTFRIALHHDGTESELDDVAGAIERIAQEQRAIFGSLPDFEGGAYTFIADYLPWASGDGMEHRNSTVLTEALSVGTPEGRLDLLATASHELFHAWNVERLRPASLEPFDFEEANESGDLWLAEGFTRYYGNLVLHRAGIEELRGTLQHFGGELDTVINSPARELRSPIEMSRMAPFVDRASWWDRTDRPNTFISYYTWGSAIALGLDLTLRKESGGSVSLDDLMRELWRRYGSVPGPAPGLAGRPWTLDDFEAVLADVAGDPALARDFVDSYVEGRQVPDYARLLERAGLALRSLRPERAWLGALDLEFTGETARVTGPVPRGSPARTAGLAQDDVIVTLGDRAPGSGAELSRLLERHAPGDALPFRFLRRGRLVETEVTLAVDPGVGLVPVEDGGDALSEEQRAFRDAWLGSRR
jgi:predicted metalloprotease with PDZ domain